MKKTRLAILLTSMLCCLLLLNACKQQPQPALTTSKPAILPTEATIEVIDGRGKTITLAGHAQKIVSLAPSNTEILFAIGAGNQIIGRDAFSDYPPEALQVKDTGGDFGKLDSEVVVTLQPDLILAASLTPPEHIQALETLGLTVFMLENPTDLDGLYVNLLTVATLTGHQEQARTLIESLKQRVAAIEEKTVSIVTRPLVFYEIDGTDPNAPWTIGPGTFIDKLISMAGGNNLGSVLENEWAQISIEALITYDPEIILLGDAYWGGVTVESVAARSGWENLTAVKNGRVYPFDDNLVSRPGPRLVAGLEALTAFLHPELFP